ncbi:nitric oxide reductase activation protein NorD [Chelatococcus reniformis]|uniref:nitric oxide reductase activation protein NorD n=1 Tax=Chelatococcus reniformis TaxID=1494448 RepID=UPI00166C3E64|nr:VWA domain-containing protein [Chelatococcus reniformis]
MAVVRLPERSPAVPAAARFEQAVMGRPGLAASFAAARRRIGLLVGHAALDAWIAQGAALYAANAGPRVLTALWELEGRLSPGPEGGALLAIGRAVHEVCRHASSAAAVAAITAAAARTRHGSDGGEAAALLAVLADAARRAPDVVPLVAALAPGRLAALEADAIAGWIGDGIGLYPQDRRRRAAYFELRDPLALSRLAIHAGASRFAAHEPRLMHLTRAVWGFDLRARPIGDGGLRRTRLAGSLLLVPEPMPQVPGERADAFFEAMAMHGAAHRRFTTERFAVGKLKPMQLALTALIEDARVELLAGAAYPGLLAVWRSFHAIPASRAQTVESLFARLSRALVDPGFADGDGWIGKGRALFAAAFAATPERQDIAREIANVLGHDLGQLRIPFIAKSYVVEPAYRDDGLGLFDAADTDPDNSEALELLIEAARVEQREQEVAGDEAPPAEEQERARPSAVAAPEEEEGRVLAIYPEWHHRLRAEQPDHATVRDYAPPAARRDWLEAALTPHAGLRARIGALVAGAKLDRPVRLKRRLEGEEIDIEAAQEVMISRRIGETPDPRIHMLKRRQRRSVAVTLLIDASASTGDAAGGDGGTVLQTACVAAALLGEALAGLGDPLEVLAFSSNGRGDVRAMTLKAFAEGAEALAARLAALTPGYSTRLGPMVRHAAQGLARQSTFRKVLIVISDGEPSDVDVDDPGYLREDAKHAVAAARAAGLDVFCVGLGPGAEVGARAIFGRRNTLAVHRIADLPQRLAALYFRLTVS